LKILICGFYQETNSFNPIITDMENFKQGGIFEGQELISQFKGKQCQLGGIIDAVLEAKGGIIPGYSMTSQSGGMVNNEVLVHFLTKMLQVIRENKTIDGLFCAFHGATQTTQNDDAFGTILEAFRNAVGENVVITASCDLHANVTEKAVQNADFICGYQSYPHIDSYETGFRSASIGIRRICNKENLYMAHTLIPMIVPANGYTSISGLFYDLLQKGKNLVNEGKICDFTIFQMQPWLDVSVGGSSVLVIADTEKAAKKYTRELAAALWEQRDNFWPDLWDIADILDLAAKNKTGKPVILVDSADSTNAGATGDSPVVLKEILEYQKPIKAAFLLDDDKAVQQAERIGVGNKGTFYLGGTKAPDLYNPVEVQAVVRSIHDGEFLQEGPAGKGINRSVGKAAVLSVGSVDIMVCKNAVGNGDPQLYRHFGIEPIFYQMVTVKANTSFLAAYRHIASNICWADTPGAASANLLRLNFQRLPHGFYPFDDLKSYKVPEPILSWNSGKKNS